MHKDQEGGQTRAGRVYPNLINRTDPDVSNVTKMIIFQLSVRDKGELQAKARNHQHDRSTDSQMGGQLSNHRGESADPSCRNCK